ncbi:MAG: hypothetical protein Q4G71_13085 [Pseudomonadota bacterium]|nr:hypothetical protein [Pseudomonadota bacterium]
MQDFSPPMQPAASSAASAWLAPPRTGTRATLPPVWLQRLVLLGSALLVALLSAISLTLALTQPWLGLTLTSAPEGLFVKRVDPQGPSAAAGVHPGSTLLAMGPAGGATRLTLTSSDLMENPDVLPSYGDWARFNQRQDLLAAWLRGGAVEMQVRTPQGDTRLVIVAPDKPDRPLNSLPPRFWLQLLAGALCLLGGAWLVVVFPLLTASWFGLVSTMSILMGATAAAVFSSRELALPASLLSGLVSTTHAGMLITYLALTCTLGQFPRQLDPGRRAWAWYALLCTFFALWAVASARHWLPGPNLGHRAMLMAITALMCAQAVRQWHACADARADHHMARLMGGAVAGGTVLCVALMQGPALLGWTPLRSQAWLYVLSAAVVLVLAVSLRRMRQLDMDGWAMGLMLAWGAGVVVLLSYQFLRAQNAINDNQAMLLAVCLCGLTYLPLHAWLWWRLQSRRDPTPYDMTVEVLRLGLAPPEERQLRWERLLGQLFRMRQTEVLVVGGGAGGKPSVRVVAQGAGLRLPPVADMPGMLLWHRSDGTRLFSRDDRHLAQRLHELVSQALQAREAYGQGATDERARIADDLHDDLGAKLLTLAHAAERGAGSAAVAGLARAALREMRLSVRNMKGRPMLAAELLADWRAETMTRLQTADIALDWHASAPDVPITLPPRTAMLLTRVLREAISNVIRHSGAARCTVGVSVSASDLFLLVEDNGRGMNPQMARRGMGLANIERRLRRLGGTHRHEPGAQGGVRLIAHVPCASQAGAGLG